MFNRIKILAFLLALPLFFACRQGLDNVPTQEASSGAKPVLTSQTSTEKAGGAMSGLNFLSNGNCQPAQGCQSAATEIIYKSNDGGQTWQDISAGLPKDFLTSRMLVDNNTIFLSAGKSYYSSNMDNDAPSWKYSGNLEVEISGFFHGSNGPFLGSYRNGFFKEIPGTGVVIPLHNNLKDNTIRTILETNDGALFVGCESGLYKSLDGGGHWKQVISGDGVNSLVAEAGVLICGTYKGLLRSEDGGEQWEMVLSEEGPGFSTGYADGKFFTVTQGGKNWQNRPKNRLRVSSDNGKTWQRMDEGLGSVPFVFMEEHSPKPIQIINDIKKAGKYLFCSCDAGVFRSSDFGKNWEPVFARSGDHPLQLAVSGDVIYLVRTIGC